MTAQKFLEKKFFNKHLFLDAKYAGTQLADIYKDFLC